MVKTHTKTHSVQKWTELSLGNLLIVWTLGQVLVLCAAFLRLSDWLMLLLIYCVMLSL